MTEREWNNMQNEMERPAQIIKVKIITVYGCERIYPLNYIGELQQLTGQKTLSRKNIEILKKLGFTFEVIGNKI